ncbi:hypothetical protein [Psychromicrobium lacuslunae]|uniref:DUF1453 domain-containing protein n=1 Tax=Psychromicrobium lacuslunae TaxID=1618207 RepID=A0A0D4BVL3_9MICC|nr:hypothetical protein [Psychromicrobium lacuslunae]AJT40487.1 hypothetical protein UM93_01095 [Psychromicrobium lacuslunae]
MSAQLVVNILLAVLVLCWVLYRQLQAKPIKERSPYTLMLVLGVLGLLQIAQLTAKVEISAIGYAALVIGLLSGAAFGWLRGRLVHLWRADDGTLMRQGNWLTIVLWVLGIAVHLGIDWIGVALSPNGQTAGAEALGTTGIMLYLAVALAAQRFATLARIPAASPVR